MTHRSGLPPEQPDAPDGMSAIVVLPIDPYRVHVYWKIEPPGLPQDTRATGKEACRIMPVLRFHDIAPAAMDLAESGEFFDVPVELDAPNWYVPLPKPSGRYLVELGFRSEDGRLTVMARSPLIQIPPAAPSEYDEEVMMLVVGDLVFTNPVPEPQEERPAKEQPLPPAPVISRPDSRSGPDAATRSFPLPPPPQGLPLMNLGSLQTIGLAFTVSDAGAGATPSSTDRERRLVEWNEASFASGQSSILLGESR